MKKNGYYLVVPLFSLFFLHTILFAQTEKQNTVQSSGLPAFSTSGKRIESEFKLAVPEAEAGDLWSYLTTNFSNLAVKKWDENYSSSSTIEVFIDQYFDSSTDILYENLTGVRYRERYIADSLAKNLIQIKLSSRDTANVAREEIKFKVYEKIKKGDRQAMHPFWRHIRPKQREKANFYLSAFQITGDDLQPTVKVQQERRRIYIAEQAQPLMTITLDRVRSYYFPYPTYTELELELNETRYTAGNFAEKKRMEAFNKQLKAQIMTQFPNLQQDQTPKYNKMYDLLKDNWLFFIYDNLMYILLGGLVAYAMVLFIDEGRKRVF